MGVPPLVQVKAKGGSPPPVDQPALVAVAKSKVVVGYIGGGLGGAGGTGGGSGGTGGAGDDGGSGGKGGGSGGDEGNGANASGEGEGEGSDRARLVGSGTCTPMG